MKTVYILGRETDTPCYRSFAERNGIECRFLSVKRSALQKAVAGDFKGLSDLLQPAVERCEIFDVITFDDGLQSVAEGIKVDLGIARRNVEVLLDLTDKSRFRKMELLREWAPLYLEFPLNATKKEIAADVVKKLSLPVVVKPSNAFYSAGVTRCDRPADLPACIEASVNVGRLMKFSRGTSAIIVEEYIDGREFAVDGFVTDDKVHCLQVHEKWPPLEGPTFHEDAYITYSAHSDEDNVQRACRFAEKVVMVSGLRNSPFHCECRLTEDADFVLEIAPRLAGGGATTQQPSMITRGIDVYEQLHCLNTGSFIGFSDSLKKSHAPVGLEIDFAADMAGSIFGMNELVQLCEEEEAKTIFQYRNDGDLMDKKGEALESSLVSFFQCSSRREAISKFDKIMRAAPQIFGTGDQR